MAGINFLLQLVAFFSERGKLMTVARPMTATIPSVPTVVLVKATSTILLMIYAAVNVSMVTIKMSTELQGL